MRRIAWVLAVSMVLVFAVAAVASADTYSTYAAWSSVGPNLGTAATPHTDYRLSTMKCAVCHSVHKAPTTGEILLPASVGNACVYCHITTNMGLTQIYSGVALNYTQDYENNHSSGGGAGCTTCHAVHGANTVTNTLVAAKILRATPGGGSWSPQASLPATLSYTSTVKDNVVTAWCTTCHPYFVGSYEATHPNSLGNVGTYDGHIMTTDTAGYHNINATIPTSTVVAYATSLQCRDCHDAGFTDQGSNPVAWTNNFPHYTTAMRFERAATSSVGASVDATNSQQDGVCLKCHRNNTTGTGIGY
jgi:predicted CXXCH cytochrome family protein